MSLVEAVCEMKESTLSRAFGDGPEREVSTVNNYDRFHACLTASKRPIADFIELFVPLLNVVSKQVNMKLSRNVALFGSAVLFFKIYGHLFEV